MLLRGFILAAALSPFCAAAIPDNSLDDAVKKLVDVYAIAAENAADPVSPEKAFNEGVMPGMLRRLDPHSVYFDAAQFQQLEELQKSTRKGFGTVVSLLPGRVTILQTLPGTPSAKTGLMAGDEIVAVNNIDLSRLEVEQLVQVLNATRQQQARLSVHRPGSMRLLSFNLTPEELNSPSVERAWLIKPGVAYLRVGSFEAETGKQIHDAIESLGGSKLRGLVLDMRENPGGVVTAALETSALFLKPEQRILSVRGRKAETQNVDVPKNITPYEFPVAILVSNKTASAAEIVSGALQDNHRATIIGEQTFGKGLVQSVYKLTGGNGLALTTAYYYTPNGRSIQRPLQGALETVTARAQGDAGGIKPDQTVQQEPTTRLRAALELSNSFASFATDYIRSHAGISKPFAMNPATVDEFRAWAGEHRIQPSLGEWSVDLPWIRSRLQQEIVNQAFGVEEGDKIEAERDPVVRAALNALKLD